MEELKPCPHCGSDVIIAYEGSHDWIIECNGCGIQATYYIPHQGDERQQAVDLWNTRVVRR